MTRKAKAALLCLPIPLLALALSAPGAQAAAPSTIPWWHLTSGPRPAYLHAGARKAAVPAVPGIPGEEEEQEIAVTLSEYEGHAEQGAFELGVGGKALEDFATEPIAGEDGLSPLTAANLKTTLEGVYGAGVNVSEEGKPGLLSFRVKSKFGSEPIEVNGLGVGAAPSSQVITPGTAGTPEVPEVPEVPDGELYVTAENLGTANADGKEAIKLEDVLPKGLKAVAVAGSKPFREGDFNEREAIPCTLTESAGVQTATCTVSEALAPYDQLVPYDQLEMRIGVNVQAGAQGETQENEASISGGGALVSAPLRRPVTISSAPVPFGVEFNQLALEEEGGAPTTQAGAHPFQLTSTIAVNQLADINPLQGISAKPEVSVPALSKDVSVKLPPGLIGNPTATPQCTTTQFFETVEGKANRCPASTAVGVATVTVHEPGNVGTATLTEPIFNLEPRVSEPARFGFYVVLANTPVFIDTSVRTGSDYGATVEVSNITQTAALLSSEVTFWGVPGDPRHDGQRGWGCIYEARDAAVEKQPCIAAEERHPKPFLTLPTSCTTPLATSLQTDAWSAPGSFSEFTGQFEPGGTLGGCNRLQFSPQLKVAPDSQQASKPTGVSVDVHVPQELNESPQGLASSNVKAITVAFPQGLALNPSAADGLEACSEAQVGLLGGLGAKEELLLTPTQASCPDASKLATVSIKSPLLPVSQPLKGALYLADPAPNGEAAQNPFNSLLAMYLIAEDPVSGVLVKLPGSATLDPSTGQITATFKNTPDLAFEDAEIHLLDGERAPLATPRACATYTTTASFTPWSGGAPVSSSSSFQVSSGPAGGPCPAPGPGPFAPTLSAGTTNINAGSFSPLSTTISRADGEQSIQSVVLHMPPGISGVLKGVPLCPEAQANAGSCPASSLIGHASASAGFGTDPFTVTGGQVFLTEAYDGAPFGLSIVTPAVAGPFNLGTVIVRAKIEVDPHTAALSATTNPSGPYSIPHILHGIPLELRQLNVRIDRPGFTFNPTDCNALTATGVAQSAEGASSPLASPFQSANCAKLKFAPKFTVSTAGKTSKVKGASLKVKLSYPSAPQGTYANLSRVKVSLPKQLPSRLTTLQKACLAAIFDANPANCHKESIVGQAKVITPLLPVPLEGPAYFVSHGGEAFPDLTIVLKGYGITIELVGSTQIKGGVTTNTFKATPDVPFSSFELSLPQGKFSALTANANLCKSKLTMPTEFNAQNGALLTQQTKIAVGGCAKAPTRAQQLQKALKACRKHAKRHACEAQAKRRFRAKGAKRSAKKR